jgi:hypothetical protein
MKQTLSPEPSSQEASRITDLKALFEEIGAGSLFGTLQSVFDQMAIAEAEIKCFTARFPGNHVDIRRAFVQLRWMLKVPVPEVVYQAHVRELLTRVVNDQSLMRGTKAEVLMLLSAASQIAPLSIRKMALYLKLFDELYPHAFDHEPVVIQEPWVGSSDELLETLRHKTKTDRRLD